MKPFAIWLLLALCVQTPKSGAAVRAADQVPAAETFAGAGETPAGETLPESGKNRSAEALAAVDGVPAFENLPSDGNTAPAAGRPGSDAREVLPGGLVSETAPTPAALSAASAEVPASSIETPAPVTNPVVPALSAEAPAPSEAPAPTVEALSAEVEALKARASGWDRFAARLPHISGYVQAGFEWSERSTTFFVKRVRLNLTGGIAKKLDYRVQIEFCSPKLVDAYLRYRPFEALNFQLGEFKLPFSIENTDYVPLKYELIEYPLSLRKLMGFSDLCGLSATGRDLGAMLSGTLFRREGYGIVAYNIGVFNGEGLNVRDRNRSKDLCARLMLRPVRGLVIAGSYYWGEYGSDYRKRIRYGAGACYDRGAVVLRGEWIGGTTGMRDAEAGELRDLDSEGWYAVAGWRATKSLMAVVRYDTFRENAASSASRQTNYTAGLVWEPVKQLRCQLDYTCEHFAARGAANRHVVAAMLTGIF